jgi:hypothetical protein
MIKKLNTIKRLKPSSADATYLGPEPEWVEQPAEGFRISTLSRAFNWYNQFYGRKDAKEMLASYLEANNRTQDAKTMRSVSDGQIRSTIGWSCRMALLGLILTDYEQTIVDDEITRLLSTVKPVVKPADNVLQQDQVKLTIQDHLREKADLCAGELEGLFDDFIVADAKMSDKFKPMTLLRTMNIAPQMIGIITEVWRLRIQEFNEVLAGKDEQLVEGYSHLTKVQLKNCVKFCETVISDCESYVNIKKTERKPRARKAVSPEKLSAKFRYLREFKDLGLKSESPAKLVEATEAWLYNTVTRKLIHVMADEYTATFTVKGTSIISFDKVTTVQKTLRKPETQLKSIMALGKPAARKEFAAIKSTASPFNGRSNDALMILKAW